MCTVCGCGEGETRIEGHQGHAHGHDHGHVHDHGEVHPQGHPEEHEHTHQHPLPEDHGHDSAGASHHHHYGLGPAHAHAPGLSQARMVQIEQDILGKNDQYAGVNRERFMDQGILALNLVSGPGSGKTSLLTRTLRDLGGEIPMAVIEGDQETSNDAERIRATGVSAIQVNTGKGCHLDAHQIGHALDSLAPEPGAILFIENVGNLVCPAAFDLGEAHKVAILSITEGEDKPIKYPDMFHAADLLLLNKIDLLPHLQFDLERCIEYARRVHPGIQVLQVSATTGQGLELWYQWLRMTRQARLIGHPALSTTATAVAA